MRRLQAVALMLLLLAAAASVVCSSATQVVIIGAGMAGIAAARQLADAGVRVLLLEARDRPGGRMHSVSTPAGRVDLGAMWIHEAGAANPLYQLATSPRINASLSRQHDYSSGAVFSPDGSRANMLLYTATYASFMSQLRRNITTMRAAAAAAAAQPNASLAVPDMPLSQLAADWVDANRARWRLQQLPLAQLLTHVQFQTLLNANASRLSTLRYGDAKTLPSADVILAGGFDVLTNALLPGLPVSFNTTVTAISQTADGVSVTTANGTQLTAPYVLVTLPLGVLKADSVAWQPPLPAAKQAAIQQMGMGLLDKVVLTFPRVFWDAGADFILRASGDASGRWSSWLNYHKVLGRPVLVALNAADTANELAVLSDAEVVAQAMQALRSMYGNSSSSGRKSAANSSSAAASSVPDPLDAHVTSWGADPHSHGSYSYYAVGNAANISDVLAQPHGRVLFAGEAASSKPGTVLGALLSGRREAGRLLALLQQEGQLRVVPASNESSSEAGAGALKPGVAG